MKSRHPSHRPLVRLGLIGLLLPAALGSAAQAPTSADVVENESEDEITAIVPLDEQANRSAIVSREDAVKPQPRVPGQDKPLASTFDVTLLEAMAQDLVANQRVPGLAMAIVHKGQILSARGYGITDVKAAEPVDAHTVFRLASLSKSFAGTVTGMLVSEGALRWDSHIVDYLPSLRFSDPLAAQQLTVADVLSHRVGLGRNTYDRDIERNADYHDLVQRLAAAPMSCQPGNCYAYQNVAFSLVGDVVFATSGQFFSEAVSRRIFKPLGMNDASYGLDGIQASTRWAKPHVRAGGGWTSLMPKPTYYRLAPAAGVNASISDMAQWLVAQTGHRPDVLPAPLLATLQAPIVGTPPEMRNSSWRRDRLDAAGYGLGWRVYDYAGQRVVFHGGAVQGYRGLMAMIPDRDFGMVVLWNSESSLPSGLLPTILDRAIGLPPQRWLDVDPNLETLHAQRTHAPASTPSAGSTTHRAAATPE
ncbi:beta-lactamase family protein [Luteimonas fraxinea]|uniref:Beta-lactamase family protein n=1 Tax=Luteimonas fraxinea TaxID=2901869 RepID=A0ABS8UH05_9GAMM|nr:serine hydrolase domain-containing protein [Luteimonas fraxinea]MCD9097984.1 beta-lactamase family protein [Luteimonas fraxinea]MCD9125449.1 beta-lactamase family protein [Luteimonas fraxinea]UHH09286.1 beta-lactamase family protein [Luteimonas fraxinea]